MASRQALAGPLAERQRASVGFTWEFDCHIFLKRALLNRELAGGAGAQRDLAAIYLAAASRAGETTAELTT